MSKKRKPNSVNPRDADWERGQMVSQAVAFAKDLMNACSVPGYYALDAVNMILDSEMDRQCASCNALHQNVNSLAYFRQAETNTTVLWALCSDCQEVGEGDDEAAKEALAEESEGRIASWIDETVEPDGVVIIFTFAKAVPRPEAISIHEIAPESGE